MARVNSLHSQMSILVILLSDHIITVANHQCAPIVAQILQFCQLFQTTSWTDCHLSSTTIFFSSISLTSYLWEVANRPVWSFWVTTLLPLGGGQQTSKWNFLSDHTVGEKYLITMVTPVQEDYIIHSWVSAMHAMLARLCEFVVSYTQSPKIGELVAR